MLEKYGFSYEETIRIVNDISFNRIEDEVIEIIVENNINYMVNKNYSSSDIKKIVSMSPRCLTVSDKKRKVIEEILYDIGMTDEQIKKLSIKSGNVFANSMGRVMDFIAFFRNLGYENEIIVKIFLRTLNIFRTSIYKLEKLYDDMLEYGFSRKDICHMGKIYPTFWSHSFNKIKSLLDTFVSIGFSKEKAISILSKSPSLIGYGASTIIDKFNQLIDLGFEKDKLINIVSEYPTLINSDINRTKNIVEFFDSIGLFDCLLAAPKGFFIQGIEVSYARYCFYIENNIEINMKNYRKLFLNQKQFKKAYNISNLELMQKYNYKNLIEKRR
jgi:hypothetical protein